MLEAMKRRRKLRDQKAQIDLAIWFTPAGRAERVEVIKSTGQPELDQLYVEIARSVDLSAVPQPPDLKQPRYFRPGAQEARFGLN